MREFSSNKKLYSKHKIAADDQKCKTGISNDQLF